MELYAILGAAAGHAGRSAGGAARSTAEGERCPTTSRWIRSYVLAEPDGTWDDLHLPGLEPEAIRLTPTAPRPSTRSLKSPTPWSCGRIQF